MKTILVPTDFSDPAQNAINFAEKLALELNSKLILLNACAVPIAAYDTITNVDVLGGVEQVSLQQLNKIKSNILAHFPNLEIECISRMGSPNDLILDMEKKHNVDAIVMGITGSANKIKEKIIGSTALDVARNCI